jgi:hypothetical protein
VSTTDKYIKAKDEELVYLLKKFKLYKKEGNEYIWLNGETNISIDVFYYKLNPDYKEDLEFKNGQIVMGSYKETKSCDPIIFQENTNHVYDIYRLPTIVEARELLPQFDICEKDSCDKTLS